MHELRDLGRASLQLVPICVDIRKIEAKIRQIRAFALPEALRGTEEQAGRVLHFFFAPGFSSFWWHI